MRLRWTRHARRRMRRYGIHQELVEVTLDDPDSVVPGHSGRTIYQRRLNGYILRVVVEEEEGLCTVVTVYKARGDRYEV